MYTAIHASSVASCGDLLMTFGGESQALTTKKVLWLLIMSVVCKMLRTVFF